MPAAARGAYPQERAMANALDFYPPPPGDVPPEIMTPSRGYRLRVLVVLTSLLLFGVLYLVLIAGSAFLCYWTFASLGSPAPSQPRNSLPLMQVTANAALIRDSYYQAMN